MEQSTEQRKSQTLLIVLAVILALGITASCVLSAMALWSTSRQGNQVAELSANLNSKFALSTDRVTQEDDVKVAGEYMILSTLPISDAYKSGDQSALDEKQKETLQMASDVLDEIITDGMSDYEKEKAVYDWMCANLHHEGGITVAVPTTSQDSSHPHGVLKYKSAVCVGFSTTFRLFMQMLDIECMVVHNSFHSWNLVKLDGDWYHTDVYSDVEEGNYANFNMTDSICATAHSWDTSFFPAATGLTYCYAYQNATKISDVHDLPSHVRQAADKGETVSLHFLFSDADETMLAAVETMLSHLDNAISQYASVNGTDLYMDYGASSVDNKYLLSITLHCTDDDGGNQLSEEELDRIQQAVNDAFGDILGDDFIDELEGNFENDPVLNDSPVMDDAVSSTQALG